VALTRQTAIDWDSFELGSNFTQAKPAQFESRSQSRQEKIDVGSGLTRNNFWLSEFDVGSSLSRRHASNESSAKPSVTSSTPGITASHNDHDDDFL